MFCKQYDKNNKVLFYFLDDFGRKNRIGKDVLIKNNQNIEDIPWCYELSLFFEKEEDEKVSIRKRSPSRSSTRSPTRTSRRKTNIVSRRSPAVEKDVEELSKEFEDFTLRENPDIEAIEKIRKSNYRNETRLSILSSGKQKVKCSWFHGNIERYHTIGDGSCFIHSVLQSAYNTYRISDNKDKRKISRNFRNSLGEKLDEKDNPPFNNWENYRSGSYVNIAIQQILLKELIDGVDYSFQGLVNLWDSNEYLGNESYAFIADILDVDIYILYGTKKDLYPISSTKIRNIDDKNSIVILGNKSHYETLGINDILLFPPQHEFIQTLRLVFEDNDPLTDTRTNIENIFIDNIDSKRQICRKKGVFNDMETLKILENIYRC